jgi:hypothetical protein
VKEPENEATLLIVEPGAEWPTWTNRLGQRAQLNLVETASPSESVEELEKRVSSRFARLTAEGMRLVMAAYVAAPSSSWRESRERLCRTLLGWLPREGELMLAGGTWPAESEDAGERAALFELWGRLSESGARQRISLRFNDDPDSAPSHLIPEPLRELSDSGDRTSRHQLN